MRSENRELNRFYFHRAETREQHCRRHSSSIGSFPYAVDLKRQFSHTASTNRRHESSLPGLRSVGGIRLKVRDRKNHTH